MIDIANWLFGNVAPLSKPKNEQLAAVIGFFFGGIGLGLYFQSFIDFIIPVLISIILLVVLPAMVSLDYYLFVFLNSSIPALWGYFRVVNSNSRLVAPANMA
jgi:hypothetical protein